MSERAQQILDRAHRVTVHEDEETLTLNTYQDVEGHLEYAAKCRRVDAEDRGAFGKRGDFHRTMSMPFNLIQMVAQRLGIPLGQMFQKEYSHRIWQELRSPEFKLFRTTTDRRIG